MANPTVSVDRTSQRFSSGAQPEPDVCVIHTTEGMGWPGYNGGSSAPHATIEAIPGKGIKVREHIDFMQNAKALVNVPGGVQTNLRGVAQFELKGTCDPKHKGDPDWYFWPDADDVVLAALAEYLRPILTRFQIPFTAPTFQAYSASYGARGRTNTVRFTNAQWIAFQGICGHQHVPENVHGDPGAFPIAKLIALLRGTTRKEELDVDVKNPLSGEKWPAEKALWSIWTSSINAENAAESALAIVTAMAKFGRPLTAAETADAVKVGLDKVIARATVNLTVEP